MDGWFSISFCHIIPRLVELKKYISKNVVQGMFEYLVCLSGFDCVCMSVHALGTLCWRQIYEILQKPCIFN